MSLTVTHEPDADRYAVYEGDELQGWIVYPQQGAPPSTPPPQHVP